MRIGGEFELSVEQVAAERRGGLPNLPRPVNLWVDAGRSAIHLALQDALARGAPPVAWLPAYSCPSVVQPFRSLGFRIHYYSQCGTLDGPPAGLPDRPEGGVLLFIHYFGGKNRAMTAWLEQGGGRGLHVIEDCVQAGLSPGVGRWGDYAIASYRKFLPVPDGALLACDGPVRIPLAMPDEAFVSTKTVARLLRNYGRDEDLYLRLFEESEAWLDDSTTPRRASWLSAYLLERLDIAAAGARRRENYRYLHKLLETRGLSARGLRPLPLTLEDGDVPIGYPVVVEGGKRNALRRLLSIHKIYCPIHWHLPHLESEPGWDAEKGLSDVLLTLPIDQRMDSAHIHYLVDRLDRFFDPARNPIE
jgi:dTDP-4-amino-4,6-dideoxygalactose transaminase